MTFRSLQERGVVLPMVAIGLLAILGTAGLAIDLGHGYLNKSRLQNALDAAALSGARTLMLSGKDEGTATEHARDAFNAHLDGGMTSLSAANLIVQYSKRLKPFADGTPDPNFIRVRYENFNTSFSFSSLLPGIGDSMAIGGTAVAGPIPVGTGGGELCSLAPILMCGEPGPAIPNTNPPAFDTDTDCSDGDCYGYDVGIQECHVLKTGAMGSSGMGMGGMGSSNFNCIEDDTGIGPGNFQLALVDENCPGGNCIRHALAGSHDACIVDGQATVLSKTGNTAGPSWQGTNTRFGDYGSNLSPADYPPDLVTDDTIWHDAYVAATATELDLGNGTGIANRRILTVPVVECDGTQNGMSSLPLLGHACFFLLEPVPNGGSDASIRGQLIEGCEAAGSPGTNPGTVDPSSGPWQIILYKDPNGVES